MGVALIPQASTGPDLSCLEEGGTASASMSVEQYLRSPFKPECEYLDGVAETKAVPDWNHSLVQSQLVWLLHSFAPALIAGMEVRLEVAPGRYRVPDVLVVRERQH